MTCDVCSKEILRGQRYQGNKYKSLHFCSEDCFKKYCSIKSKPKAVVNFKPEKGTSRRKFTDYIQDWTDDKINWPMAMKQAKDIQEEYELSWHDMLMVLKYAREYDNYVWDLNYGLYQVFPKYIEPTQDFVNAINKAKNTEIPEEETYVVKRKRNYTGKVEW